MLLHLFTSKNQLRHDVWSVASTMRMGIRCMVAPLEAKSFHVAGEPFVFGLQVDGAVRHGD
eukprot:3455345-Prorocentrum_lima.AAC.1